MRSKMGPGPAAFKAAGADVIDCSSGQVSKKQKPVYGRMFQTPFADRIRNEVGIATMAVGAISEADHVNSIIAAGRADLCAVARPHLANPAWSLLEAATRLAVELDHPAYDCLYLALAIENACPFVTADDQFVSKLGRTRRRALRGKAISLSTAVG